MDKKILTISEIQVVVEREKQHKSTIVTYNGSFDLLHIGHIKSIQEAKKQGDILIMLLNSDVSVKKYKSSKRPIVSQKERAEILASLEATDYITLFDEITPKHILEIIKPNIHCNGSDWGEDCVEREVVENYGGRIHILHWEKGYSTTNLIQKILDAYNTPLVKAVFLTQETFTHEEEEMLKDVARKNYNIILLGNQQKEQKAYITAIYPVRGDAYETAISQAVKDFDISLNTSWIVGGEGEVILGRNMNMQTIKLGIPMDKKYKLEPNHYAENVKNALLYISEKK